MSKFEAVLDWLHNIESLLTDTMKGRIILVLTVGVYLLMLGIFGGVEVVLGGIIIPIFLVCVGILIYYFVDWIIHG